MSGAPNTEAQINRNPHGDFKQVEASRPPYVAKKFDYTQAPRTDWKAGHGRNDLDGNIKQTISIDPYEEGRPAVYNYKLLISGITPRPIGFISSISKDGVANLAPFSYTQMVNHDPPMFVIGFAGSADSPKDTLANILDTKEFVLNMVSEHFVEAMNFTSINAPAPVSEWALSGLTQASSMKIKPARVAESIFSIECKLDSIKEWRNKDGKNTGVTIFGEGIMFHVREDAINDDKNLIDPAVLKSVARLGGITYAVLDSGFEIPRPDYDAELKNETGAILKL